MPRSFSAWHGRRSDPSLFQAPGEQESDLSYRQDIDLQTLVDTLLAPPEERLPPPPDTTTTAVGVAVEASTVLAMEVRAMEPNFAKEIKFILGQRFCDPEELNGEQRRNILSSSDFTRCFLVDGIFAASESDDGFREKRWVKIEELVEKISKRDLEAALKKWRAKEAADTEREAPPDTTPTSLGTSSIVRLSPLRAGPPSEEQNLLPTLRRMLSWLSPPPVQN